MKKIIAIIAVSGLFCATTGFAEELVIKGTQIKGNAGRNAEIKSSPVKLKKPAKIVKIEGGSEGLCIESPAESPLCGTVKELVGKTLKPASYTVYPNIPTGKEQATVTVYLK